MEEASQSSNHMDMRKEDVKRIMMTCFFSVSQFLNCKCLEDIQPCFTLSACFPMYYPEVIFYTTTRSQFAPEVGGGLKTNKKIQHRQSNT